MADTAHDVLTEYIAAQGDIDAVLDLYEEDALYVVASMDVAAKGRAAIRSVLEGFAALFELVDMKVEDRDLVVDGDHAYAHLHGTMRIRALDSGDEQEMPLRATEVLHRGADGRWRYQIDHA